ncbi:MAG: hypothetical protein IKM58_05630 [Tidjanibacter sp.]|nr:hypothetical protein [Tidjanibacter sp.]
MKATEYIVHALKYLTKLIVLLLIIYALMFATGMARISADQFLHELFHENNGVMLILSLVVLAFIYPKFGFVKRTVEAGINTDHELIMRAFSMAGYVMTQQSEGRRVYRASSPMKRVMNVFDDKIVLTYDDEQHITLDGIRKEVVQMEFRLKSYVNNKTE